MNASERVVGAMDAMLERARARRCAYCRMDREDKGALMRQNGHIFHVGCKSALLLSQYSRDTGTYDEIEERMVGGFEP